MESVGARPVYLTEIHRLPETRRLRLVFEDGFSAECTYDLLRGFCPCAGCQGHWAEAVRYHPPVEAVEPVSIEPVGNYAISIHWSDGHATGIYRFEYLRSLCEREEESS